MIVWSKNLSASRASFLGVQDCKWVSESGLWLRASGLGRVSECFGLGVIEGSVQG